MLTTRFAIIGVIIAAVGFIIGGLYLIRQAEEEITVLVPELYPEANIGRASEILQQSPLPSATRSPSTTPTTPFPVIERNSCA